MEIIERDNKYYMKLANGELEISEQQAMQMVRDRGAVLRNNLKNWMDNFTFRPWALTRIPYNSEDFFKADDFFNDIIREFEQIYHEHKDPDTTQQMIDFCEKNITGLQNSRSTSHNHPSFIDYEITCWNRVIAFINGMDNR